ncbi:hypothetical protein F4777DRAFT_572509 [Nemania sp. FL0916]|nr:hypothetical protein F4777DRAFT_572509 [Nemania sp. FL0916]
MGIQPQSSSSQFYAAGLKNGAATGGQHQAPGFGIPGQGIGAMHNTSNPSELYGYGASDTQHYHTDAQISNGGYYVSHAADNKFPSTTEAQHGAQAAQTAGADPFTQAVQTARTENANAQAGNPIAQAAAAAGAAQYVLSVRLAQAAEATQAAEAANRAAQAAIHANQAANQVLLDVMDGSGISSNNITHYQLPGSFQPIGTQYDVPVQEPPAEARRSLNSTTNALVEYKTGLASRNPTVTIKDLPDDCIMKDLFTALTGCGKIFEAILYPAPVDGRLVAKVMFWNCYGSTRLLAKTRLWSFSIKGKKPSIVLDADAGPVPEARIHQSRVAMIYGPPNIVDRNYLELQVLTFGYQLEDAVTRVDLPFWRCLEFRFASIRYAVQAMTAINYYKRRTDFPDVMIDAWKEVTVRFGFDPCDPATKGM